MLINQKGNEPTPARALTNPHKYFAIEDLDGRALERFASCLECGEATRARAGPAGGARGAAALGHVRVTSEDTPTREGWLSCAEQKSDTRPLQLGNSCGNARERVATGLPPE